MLFHSMVIAGLAFFMGSCVASKMRKIRKLVHTTGGLYTTEMAMIAHTDAGKESAFEAERIDSSIYNLVNSRLLEFRNSLDSVRRARAELDKALVSKRVFKATPRNLIRANVGYLEKYASNKNKRVLRQKKLYFIDDALEITDKKSYDLAAFFGPGKYNIPTESYETAIREFLPLVDSIARFANTHDSLNSIATIVINGFADGSAIAQGSELYNLLCGMLKKTECSKEELNAKISELRAEQISVMTDDLFRKKGSELFKNPDNILFKFYGYGQGETFPSKMIKDYAVDDPRRRIVLIYWIVLPN